MSFGRKVIATKIELIKIRRSVQVARMVHKILDDKREVLLKKIDEMIEEANKDSRRYMVTLRRNLYFCLQCIHVARNNNFGIRRRFHPKYYGS